MVVLALPWHHSRLNMGTRDGLAGATRGAAPRTATWPSPSGTATRGTRGSEAVSSTTTISPRLRAAAAWRSSCCGQRRSACWSTNSRRPACCGQSGTVATRSTTAARWAAPRLGLRVLGRRNDKQAHRGGGGLGEGDDAGTCKRGRRRPWRGRAGEGTSGEGGGERDNCTGESGRWGAKRECFLFWHF
jgi:hypothetical protein